MPRGINVNCVDPGPSNTGYADPETTPETTKVVAGRSPGGRWSTPADVAKLVA